MSASRANFVRKMAAKILNEPSVTTYNCVKDMFNIPIPFYVHISFAITHK